MSGVTRWELVVYALSALLALSALFVLPVVRAVDPVLAAGLSFHGGVAYHAAIRRRHPEQTGGETQLVASVKWETHSVLLAVGLAFPLLWLAASDRFVRWLSKRALRVEVVRLDPVRNAVELRFADPRRAAEVVALTEETRVANLEAAEELLESSVG